MADMVSMDLLAWESWLWLWFNTEHLTNYCAFQFLSGCAQDLYQKVAWCSVLHPELYLKATELVDQGLSMTYNLSSF